MVFLFILFIIHGLFIHIIYLGHGLNPLGINILLLYSCRLLRDKREVSNQEALGSRSHLPAIRLSPGNESLRGLEGYCRWLGTTPKW